MSWVIPLLTFYYQSQFWFQNSRSRCRHINMRTPTNETPMQLSKQPLKEQFIQPTMQQLMQQHNMQQLIQQPMQPPTDQIMQQPTMQQLIQQPMQPPMH